MLNVTEPALAMPEPPSVLRSELATPLPDGFVGNENAALREEFLDIAEAQGEPMVLPDTVPMISGGNQ